MFFFPLKFLVYSKGLYCSFLNVYFILFFRERERERERQSMSRGGAEREEDTESKAGSRLQAVSTEPNTGFKLMNHKIMT